MSNVIESSAHPTGKTCVAFSGDGQTIYSGGSDSLVRIWAAGDNSQEPDTAVDANEPITSLATGKDCWISGAADSIVRRYGSKSTQIEGFIFQTPGLSIHCVAVDPNGARIAVTSEELSVQLIDLANTTNMKLLEGLERGARSATWHPSGSLLTTCGSDGKIMIWDVSGDEPKLEKVIDALLPAVKDTESTEFQYDCSALWHPSGQYFFVATKAHEIVTISRNTWSKASSYNDDACSGAITALALSSNGVYLASACKSGIFIWSTTTRKLVAQQPLPKDRFVCQLAFSPSTNLLVWTDNDGCLSRWFDFVPSKLQDPAKKTSAIAGRQGAAPLFAFDEPQEAGVQEENVMDLDDVDLDAQDDDWIIDDLGGGMRDKPEIDRAGGYMKEMVSVTKAQGVFQPGATHFVNKRRYLSFNNIGVVEVVDQDTNYIINVEFHDQSTRKNYHFTDYFKFDMAAIGERGIAYACPPESDHPAQIVYKPYATWATQGEWKYMLPKDERVIAVAAGGTTPRKSLKNRTDVDLEGNGFVAIATDKGVIRFFSGGGMQRGPIWAVDGDIISMIAGRDYVFVVHREGGTSLDGNQNLKYTLRTTDTYRVMHTGRLPVNKGQTLLWIGISDEGAPVIYDSAERLLILEHYRFTAQGSWAVLLDAKTLARREGKDESYWPVGVTQSTLMCVILKGRETQPGFPRPLAQEIEIIMPYINSDSAETKKEERLARETILLDHIRDALDDDVLTTTELSAAELSLDKEIIQLIQLACKSDQTQRALDAVQLLHHTLSLDMAIKVAEFYHLTGLQEKINVIKEARSGEDRLRDERDERKGWRRAAGSLRSKEDQFSERAQESYRPLQATGPPQPIHRPGLAAATPSYEPSPFKPTDGATLNRYPSPGETKRKRDTFDRPEPAAEDTVMSNDTTTKRRATDENMGSSSSSRQTNQSKPNPFAAAVRRSDAGPTNNANPFLRKIASHKSVHKSESFFDKVDAAETEKIKKAANTGKAAKKAAKPGVQATLSFASKLTGRKESDSRSETPKRIGENHETGLHIAADGPSESVIDTQQETQETLVYNSQTQLETFESQETELNDDEDPIEWPASPPPLSEEPMMDVTS